MESAHVQVSAVLSVCAGAAAHSLKAELDREVSQYRVANFSVSTRKTYQTHLRLYLAFCEVMDIGPVPASEQTIAQYAAYLARRLKPSSVKQYLNIIRTLHLKCGHPHPFKDSWYVKTTLTGIEKAKGCVVHRKTPLTPDILLPIKRGLNLSCVEDCVFWAACLVLFFGFLRKSNLFQDNGDVDASKQLTRDCFLETEQSTSSGVKLCSAARRY